ncbi:MAG: putative ABC transporter permease subunit [Planctomycetia bacterium]
MNTASPPGTAVRLLAPETEARLLLRLRATIAWQTLRSLFAVARLRMSLAVVLSGIFWGAIFLLSLEGFRFLRELHADVVSLLFNAFFLSLTLMLVFSAGILLYSGMYCSTESRLLMTLPIRAEAFYAHKAHEALWFAGWGFLLLGSPLLVAFGVEQDAGWLYYVMLPVFMLSFVTIPTVIGGIACMVLVAWLPRLRVHALTAALVACCAAAIWLGWSFAGPDAVRAATSLPNAWFERAFSRLAFAEQKLLPSWWLSSGLVEAAVGSRGGPRAAAAVREAGWFLALLVANALFLHMLAGRLAGLVYRRGYSGLASAPARRRRRRGSLFDEALTRMGSARTRPLRLLLVKDLRLFRRDIAQWSQFLIFFGLLGLYFLNLGSFQYHNAYASLIGFLNLAVVGLILSTFTTRFVYPMISLEGRRFWILGLLPVHRDQIVWSKFLFSFVGSLAPCCGLVLLSNTMLGIPMAATALQLFSCGVLCLGLSGLAVGLGARMPDFRELSAAKIASGFGGTLCLVLSSLFIMLVVLIAAVPTHFSLLAGVLTTFTGRRASGLLGWSGGPWGWAAATAVVGLLGLVAAFVPLRLGLRAFRRLEP